MPKEPMTLFRAVHILAEVHTRGDAELGFRIEVGASPYHASWISYADWQEAWGVVRREVGLPYLAKHERDNEDE